MVMRRNRRLGGLAAVLIVILGMAWFLVRPGDTPVAQPPFVTLDSGSFETLRADFNRDAGRTRLVVLLSPT